MNSKIQKSNDEWRELLTPEQYRVTRLKGTEPAFSGVLLNEEREGKYLCVCCKAPLFDSEAKFDSGSGWPSFTQPISREALDTHPDTSYGQSRTEILCANCDAHLGHVFEDGPLPARTRHCVNSIALEFQPDGE